MASPIQCRMRPATRPAAAKTGECEAGLVPIKVRNIAYPHLDGAGEIGISR